MAHSSADRISRLWLWGWLSPPILLFLVTGRTLPGWRARLTSVSLVLLISMNGWRFIGLGFLMANIEGLLPGGFAWPAGLGDIIMAVTAPWVAARVAADDRFRFTTVFLLWNLFGMADFLDAVLLGTLYNTGLMQRLPFVLIPCARLRHSVHPAMTQAGNLRWDEKVDPRSRMALSYQ